MTDGDSPVADLDREGGGDFRGDQLSRQTAPPELEDEENRKRWGLGNTPDERGPYMVELNVQHVDGLAGAASAFVELFTKTVGDPDGDWDLVKISKAYYRCDLNLGEWKRLIAADETQAAALSAPAEAASGSRETPSNELRYRTVYKLWPDFPVHARITRSIGTIKADAALRSFDATGEGITWAVVDSGVEGRHPHFGDGDDHSLMDPWVRNLHRCFVPIDGKRLDDPDEERASGRRISKATRDRRIELHRKHALDDGMGHGTHVAGIIAGRATDAAETVVLEREDRLVGGEEQENLPRRQSTTTARTVRSDRERERFHGVAPDCRIVSLRVLDENGVGRSSNIVRALEYIREKLNDNPKLLRVHGVNLSVGYEFDAEMFACGQSPLCTEVNRLVQSGVVVVAAAGNTGYSTLTANGRVTKVGLSNTINDPGNAEYAITVGSTHRESPHTFGISYFSSKGPTGDGRLKPDLVAPGERITSCAAGAKRDKALKQMERTAVTDASMPAGPVAGGTGRRGRPTADAARELQTAYYVEDSGTSMAAPHVSGAIAAFLSIRREFIGRSTEVKRIFLSSAVPLGRERYFEGHGLVDVMKAIQSV